MADDADVPAKGPAPKDVRADWLRDRVCSSLKVRDEQVQKLFLGDAKAALAAFLDEPETRRLLVFYDGKDLLASTKPLPKFKKKAVYFVKKSAVKLENDTIGKEVLHGELTDAPLETLAAVAQSVFLPLLSSAQNQEGWPDVVAREVTENVHNFVANVKVSIGESKGQTLLPLPAADPGAIAAVAAAAAAAAAAPAAPAEPGSPPPRPRPGHLPLADAEKVHILEAAVVTWTKQIKKVLLADSDAPLKEPGAHPGPLVELDFWKERAESLASIHEQLSGERIQKVVRVLELAHSTYHPAFQRLLKDVEAALLEASDNVRFLAPLRRHLEKLSLMDDFVALVGLFKPIMHTSLLIWKHSRFYNTTARMATLLREVCNDLIAQAQRFAAGQELLRADPSEAVDKLRLTLKVLGAFKSYYFAYRGVSAVECPSNPWRFQNAAVFGRLDSHMARCAEMLTLAGTVLQFSRLERVEIGGTRGKTISAAIKAVHADFTAAYERFQQVQYDVMDVDAPNYAADHEALAASVSELEHRLGALIIQAFDDCTTLSSTFKLLESFEGLLEREAIAAELTKKQAELVKAFAADVAEVTELFEAGREAPVLSATAPLHAGAVAWVRGLKGRLAEPYGKLAAKEHGALLEGREGRAAAAAYAKIMEAMDAYEAGVVDAWCRQVDNTSDEKLNLPLLQFHEEATPELPLLAVNFDPALVALLRETKYFLLAGVAVPAAAASIYERADTYRSQISSLDLMVTLYNRIQRTILAVERPLVDGKLAAVESALRRGLEELRWRSDAIDGFLRDALAAVRDLDGVLATLKDNVRRTQDVLRVFSQDRLMFERKEGRVYTAEELAEASAALLSARHSEMRDAGKEIGKLLSASNRAVKASKTTPAWRDYVEYASGVVVDGFAAAITASAGYLLSQMDPDAIAKSGCGPLLEIQLELVAPEVVWSPELGSSGVASSPGARDLVTRWLAGFLGVGSLVKRLDVGEGSYGIELEEESVVYDALGRVMEVTLANEARCEEFRQQFLRFDFLWKTDSGAVLREFLQARGAALPDGGRDDPPLSAFEEQIQKFKAVAAEVAALPGSATLGWLRVSAKPLKQTLATWASKWVFLFTKYLQDKVTGSVAELSTFMDAADATLTRRVLGEGEPEAAEGAVPPAGPATPPDAEAYRAVLYDTMATMRDVRKRSERTDAMFEPLRETVSSLAAAGVALPDGVLRQLESAEARWRGLKKRVLNRREELAALQQAEAVDVRRKSDAFNERVEDYRKFFLKRAPFAVPGGGELKLEHVRPAYSVLDAFHHTGVDGHPSVKAIIAESKQLQEWQDLFELYVQDYLPLTRCAEDLLNLKSTWDTAAAVLYTFADWYKTPWDKIDVDFLVEETKKLAKEVKSLNKAVRNFEVYRLLEEALKAMLTSLPLVQDLHHPAMRDRHWKMLMQATGKVFVMDARFALGDLLALELHNYVDACSEIVDRAQKELNIEKQLKRIEDTWRGLALEFVPYQDTDVNSLHVDDAITEALENDNLQLQGLASQKYVALNPMFGDAVASWQRRLGAVDAVLNTWLDVQKKWQALESIFVGSADIRVQLPEDSKRFGAVNADYQDLMRTAVDVTNVVEAANMDGRQERLEGMLVQLESCEKALQDYLETKRIAFPRFYFVAPADLLDILSKGSNPQLILRHLPKNFDNLHNLSFRADERGEPTKAATGMYSGEGEYVEFVGDCMCDGPVETWLQHVVDAMKAGLAAEFKRAMPTYDEVPRTTWILRYSAQATVVVSRTFFTQEVNEAFDELEEGNEDALKAEYERQVSQLAGLIEMINSDLSKLDRKKLITLCTIDVHARDVVQRLIDERVESAGAFQWQSQLRYLVSEKTKGCQVNICDAEIAYCYEYIGNCGALCITPLTDRCYITLTQAQRLMLGGAPAGPAGTGKTETTKDLARALGVQCYVFNCSDQMDYKAMGQIYKGLAQTGAWGCFDEFNRIPVAVLSVCSTQYKTVLDALRGRKERFVFEDVEICLKPSVMAFITMNPGYPGRAELPESLKALFRPVSMVLPDLALICEIMLMAEGFQNSKLLSRKFIILYKLCEDLLSKSKHYDWKLRAIKTTLYVAGGMKRAAPELTEDKVLLRALRDFNLGKLTSDDTSIFVGLLNDLFPKTLELVPRAREVAFEAKVRDAALELGYQPDETFCLKIGQLRELFVVRWSVFLLGPAGCGKSAIWRTLMKAQNNAGERTVYRPINPKAVTRNELYGYLHPQTREWREGLVSVTFRDFSNNTSNQHQWIVLDGDIDAEWIESMNTVMDDNKMLTLASNERIPLTPSMRLLLEINHMNHCSPATVSRGGVIFVNVDDVGWKPVVDSWIERLEAAEYRPLLTTLFSRYVDPCLEYCRRNFKTVVPLPAVNQVMTVCRILEGILPKESVRGAPPPDKKLLEHHFVFACVWAFGGCMLVDKVTDHRAAFSKWWVSEWKGVAFPEKGSVYDYYVDPEACLMVPWDERVPKFSYAEARASGRGASRFVPTVETTRLTYFLDSLLANRHYVMFVGNTGTGKTAVMMNKLRGLDPEAVAACVVNMNSFSDAPSLQLQLEGPLEKKSGVRYGPPGSRRLVYFIDDLNMPYVDKYDTQSAIELARQMVDYRGWYDKQKILLKEILNCQYAAAMNPTAGSFNITPRMQRHFVTFAVQMPGADIVRSIYAAIVDGHVAGASLDEGVARLAPKLVDATIELHRMVMHNFLPSAVKFHYQFNLRELSNVVGGLCRMTKDEFKEPVKAVRLWLHECERVFRDRLVSDADAAKFDEFRAAVAKKYFDDAPGGAAALLEERPLLFTSFMQQSGDEPVYAPVSSYETLRKVLDDRLAEYNETNTVMELVLFQQAMEHVTRIARILDLPRGHAMLVGVGGSGKQSLARLAAHICGYDVYQIAVSSSYGVADFREALLGLYAKTGAKGVPTVFLLTDNQIVKEQFLVYINDLLSTGLVADLFTPEDRDGFINAVRNEVKAQGILDTPEACWDFFLAKARRLLHVVLCFSPVGDKFRVRARQFPALVNCTQFDWFHGWPREALVSVAQRFLASIPDVEPAVRDQLGEHMAHAHTAVSAASAAYLETQRRYNYTTPKSYLELISLYKDLLARKRRELRAAIERLQNGVEKIAQASAQVADLQAALKQEQIIVEEKKAATDELIVSIGREKAVVDEAVEAGRGDEEAAAALQSEVQNFQEECSKDLAVAEPVIAQAEAALNSLDKASLGELKSFGSPAAEVVQVVSACMVLTAPGGRIPKDLSWAAGKKFMGNVDAFLKSLLSFDRDNVPVNCVDAVERDYISNAGFTPDNIKSKSSAAAGLCAWVINIAKYFRIYQVVAPKRAALAEANRKLEAANRRLAGIRARVKELQDKVAALEVGLMKATEDKNAAIAQAERTSRKAGLADRLVNGLSGENKRWSETIRTLEGQEGMLVGNALLAAAFVSYAGPFNMAFRQQLVTERWLPDILERGIPISKGIKPLDLLTDDSTKAKWAQEGLPTDPLSVENGAIMTNAARWSLMIDPQLQGIKWIKKREAAAGLVVLQQSQPKYVDKVLACIEQGTPLLLENLPVDLDAVLDPVLGKRTVKRGRALVMKVGDAEVECDPNFRLYLQTKLANPHYKPEIAAQCTLVNFCVTEKGLEDQLLALVVDHERPDLQEAAAALVAQLGAYTIQLKELEDGLLARLANAQGDILEDIALVENLEETKRTAGDIAERVVAARLTEVSLSTAREVYRPVAARGALVYFLIDGLHALDRVYHYSMANFVGVLVKGMDATPGSADESAVPKELRTGAPVELEQRVQLLVDTTCATVFNYVAQGLFERHKLIVSTQLCMAVLRQRGELQRAKFDALLRGPKVMGVDNPLSDWVPEGVWGAVQALREIDDYATLPDDLVGSSKRWREWMELERPEDEPLPGDWKRMPEFERLLLFRALRPDRLTAAMKKFVTNVIGAKYVTGQPYDLARSLQDAGPGTPILALLSPGVDVAASVEALGARLGYTAEGGRYAAVALGQGQEPIAMAALETAHRSGGWVLLQNIHLTIDWTAGPLEKRVDKLTEGAHPEFRLFLSAEPPPALERALPISLLQNSVKLTNEPPEGLKANLRRAYANFSEEMLEGCAKQAEFRTIVFALCYFHAALLERKKFGVGNLPGATSGIGWNMNYPFNTGDLLCCGQTAVNYLENNAKVPWDDLRYIFGEIMYGGHIVEDWDRRLANGYLSKYFNEALLEGVEMFPGFPTPTNSMNQKQVLDYIDEAMPPETPLAFGLHPNAEIGFKLREGEGFCSALLGLQPSEAGAGGGMGPEEAAKMVLDDLADRLPPEYDLEEVRGRVDEVTPYAMVAIQECERMNALLREMRRSLAELDLGLRGDLTMSEPMVRLLRSLAADAVPASWRNLAYPSLRPLGSWLSNLLARAAQLTEWTADLGVPRVVWLSGLFNPQSFLTAVMQTTARRNDWPLDKTVLVTEVTKKTPETVDAPSRDGAFVHGLTLEGARWDDKAGALEESRPKELFCPMPVLLVRAVTADKAETRDAYMCPVYTTEARFREEVFTAQLKTRGPALRWVLAGVCMFLDVV
ncbi:flagellar outer dynein arm heavy chain beta [Raphidocelis subcapitata]|uniref:Flagellar outer dynein arm heavy chain beta n=1 Tax=Raphidocelis subcapitata TaxID=307507 RepID=A0A2V0PIA7_9CHLO|nr:flagellar outer dynein arm heavy chain beta [Raphidocelis subcapitata]|eukprot:GBF97683.1 flagellar outer dynein arm heavy chain beta [Raphidocelis subcapitata]